MEWSRIRVHQMHFLKIWDHREQRALFWSPTSYPPLFWGQEIGGEKGEHKWVFLFYFSVYISNFISIESEKNGEKIEKPFLHYLHLKYS